jgi:hypothetical protein
MPQFIYIRSHDIQFRSQASAALRGRRESRDYYGSLADNSYFQAVAQYGQEMENYLAARASWK